MCRFYAQSAVIGSNIVVVCGSESYDSVTEVVDVYDIATDTMFTDIATEGHYLSEGRKSCCLMKSALQSKLYISGGETIDNGVSSLVDDIISSGF